MKTTIADYNESYKKFTPEWFENTREVSQYLMSNRESIMDFFASFCKQFDVYPRGNFADYRILDAGCGLGSVTFGIAAKGADVLGVDISELAIMGAKSIATKKNLNCKFQVADLTDENLNLGEFDFIIDSHLYHCLTTEEQRKNYLNFIFRNLKPEGKFFLESMVYHNGLEVPVDYQLDENMVLHQYLGMDNNLVPIRKLADAIQIENEIKNSGLELNYFYYHAELSFQVFANYKNYPHQKLPHTIRAVAMKKSN